MQHASHNVELWITGLGHEQSLFTMNTVTGDHEELTVIPAKTCAHEKNRRSFPRQKKTHIHTRAESVIFPGVARVTSNKTCPSRLLSHTYDVDHAQD